MPSDYDENHGWRAPEGMPTRLRSERSVQLTSRYHALVDKRFVSGLTDAERTELEGIEQNMDIDDETFYAPLLRRLHGETVRLSVSKLRSMRGAQ